MAAANAWGLLLSTFMLGYGLVEVPRGLWYDANVDWCLRYLEFRAPKVKEAMVDAEADLYEAAREIAVASKKVDFDDPLRPFVDRLMEKCPLSLEERTFHEDAEEVNHITADYLRSLHERIIHAVKMNNRSQAQYRFLVLKAFKYQDILTNYRNPERKFKSTVIRVRDDKFKDAKLTALWWWYSWIRPITLRFFSILFMLGSLALIWSESTFQVDSPVLSVPALILQNPDIGNAVLQIVSMSFIVYMCICAYSTLFKVNYFDIHQLVPEHHSDEGSLLFIGSYLCKLTFPLCYNFLNMVRDKDNSVFVRYQGQAVNLTALLGEGYNNWLPLLVLIISVITFLNLHGRIMRLLKLKSYFYEQINPNDVDVSEGRGIIEQERGVEERRARGGAGTLDYSAQGLEAGTRASSRRAGGGGAQSSNVQDLLAKYKSRGVGRSGGGGGRSSAEPLISRSDSNDSTASGNVLGSKKSSPLKGSGLFGMFGAGDGASSSAAGAPGKFQRLEEGSPAGSLSPSTTRSGRKFGVGEGGGAGGKGDAGGAFALGGLSAGFGGTSKGAGASSNSSTAGSQVGAGRSSRPPPKDMFGDL
ncbi:LMBR1 domain-containing protein 2 [Rhizophlyctis rosea]|nr:LMBR1 domain-containing protein 2 [Rhizophlyctis rosea]